MSKYLNQMTNYLIQPQKGVLIYLLMMYFCVAVGQLNPSVSIALLVSHKQGLVQTILMICVQLLGSLTAVGLLSATVPNIQDSRYGANYLSPKVTQGNAVMGESVATFLLVIVVLQVISQKNAATIAPIAIGFAVLIAHFLLLAIDGCSINPARSFGPAVASGHWDDFWVFVVGPISGALFAAAAHSLIAARQEVQEEVEKDIEAYNVKTDSV
eukprot:TRINITY_DN3834_c1_g3_i2.p1 TRINITY_DN3834_c1_g3~~TRINITY_DN3834_c1_g3_i2.p1  ORF type:complete len:213 (+),score=45.39 TRINITY_DN3834_c1_g3_i2:51-689(+)